MAIGTITDASSALALCPNVPMKPIAEHMNSAVANRFIEFLHILALMLHPPKEIETPTT
jgi:hypothetical protein